MRETWTEQFLRGCKVLESVTGNGVRARVRRAISRLKMRWWLRGVGSVVTVRSDGRVQEIRKRWPLGRFHEVKPKT